MAQIEIENYMNLIDIVLRKNHIFNDYLAANPHCDYEDLFQEGCLALIHAAKTYDGSRAQFKTYASKVIYTRIYSAIKKDIKKTNDGICFVDIDDVHEEPQTEDRYDIYYEDMKDKLNRFAEKQPEKMRKAIKLLIAHVEEDRTIAELCSEYGLSEKDVQNQKAKIKKIYPIDIRNLLLYN